MEDIRKDTESDNYNKYGYLRNDDGSFIQVGIRANNVRNLTDSFSYQTLVEKLEKNDQIIYASFINNDLENEADSREEKIGDVRDRDLIQTAVNRGEIYSDQKSYNHNDQEIEINELFVPVEIEGEQIGVLNLAISMEEIYTSVNEARRRIIYISAGLFILISLILFLSSNNVIKALDKMVIQCGEISKGNISQKIPEDLLERKDELGVLAGALNKMKADLSNILEEVSDIAENLSTSSEELTASGEEVATAAQQVGQSIQQVASGAEEQSAQVEETSSRINELINQIDDVSKMSAEMDEQADKVMNNIEEGNSSIDNSVNQIEDVKSNSHAVAGTINSLGELSNKIGEIVQMINDIAAQTNLLALNAAIEAARAGEAGRGFSVVADEIRQLAEESEDATNQIGSLVREIQDGVANAVDKMDNTEEVVDGSVDAIRSTGRSFEEINSAALRLRDLIENINQQTDKVSRNSTEVESTVKEIASVSEEAASNSEEVAAASEEQSASTEEIVSAAEELTNMADQLRESVNNFDI
ncbi:MAG: methyl-accepting chemotaxis protein [Halanaerobium sp.]